MDLKNFTYLLEHPEEVSPQETRALEDILMNAPYFQAARAIRLKGLKDADSPSYNSALRKTAAFTTDREILFEYISSIYFNQNRIAHQIKIQDEKLNNLEVYEPIEVLGKKSMAIDEAIQMKQDESDKVMDPELFERSKNKKSEEELPEEQLKIGKPLQFNNAESHSFSEWLRLTSAKPLEQQKQAKKEEDAPENIQKKFDIIDRFISKNPKIKPAKSSPKATAPDLSSPAPEALMTETLARVYLEQKNYKKAIQAYKILILKNPEKSGFFADQIRAIEKLQENNTDKE
ncbi:hypothetical protein INR75_07195 [Zunongwangia sp. SCSIO 43204]|uniref:hypothetical protein n=1 Tax=Zunongwangia sp. SCSIO 43204 TaxID=2779359 RepID=UPI001CA8D719|nr:hypothetical protein [Zunongwangia sp. SCSIO 43204]UAB85789.1 hypothetical protein INR75_07195 [Zunongwangia sp. SCSIO 43204]